MSKIKSIYDLLQPKLKDELKASVRDLCSYSDLYTYQLTAHDIMYGDKFLSNDE